MAEENRRLAGDALPSAKAPSCAPALLSNRHSQGKEAWIHPYPPFSLHAGAMAG